MAAALLSLTLLGTACEATTTTLDGSRANDSGSVVDAAQVADSGSGADVEIIDYGPALPPYGIPPEDAGVRD